MGVAEMWVGGDAGVLFTPALERRSRAALRVSALVADRFTRSKAPLAGVYNSSPASRANSTRAAARVTTMKGAT